MRVIGFCGLHGAGKSHAVHALQRNSGWPHFTKLDVLKGLQMSHWHAEFGTSWLVWYRSLYIELGSEFVTRRILDEIGSHPICILDAIHSMEEWNTIVTAHPGSVLVGVSSPKAVREARRDEPASKDASRIRFWHDDGDCLQSYVDWAIPGMLSGELLDRVCGELIVYVNASPSSNPSP